MTDELPAWTARKLLRAARAGTLATAIEGQPFASLVTPATAPDGSILLLLSDLSEHTRHLRTDPRCAVMVQGSADGPNAQTAPRLTVTGYAAIANEWKPRWVAVHPYAAFYADFGDFNLWRVEPGGGQFIGGFARAFRITAQDLMVDAPAVSAAEAAVIAHCNDDHGDALDAIAGAHGLPAPARMVLCDADGFDLVHEDRVLRIPFAAPVDTPGGIRAALVDLARAARNPALSNPGREESGPV